MTVYRMQELLAKWDKHARLYFPHGDGGAVYLGKGETTEELEWQGFDCLQELIRFLETADLKPCRFCGRADKVVVNSEDICCTWCKATMPEIDRISALPARERWNRRP